MCKTMAWPQMSFGPEVHFCRVCIVKKSTCLQCWRGFFVCVALDLLEDLICASWGENRGLNKLIVRLDFSAYRLNAPMMVIIGPSSMETKSQIFISVWNEYLTEALFFLSSSYQNCYFRFNAKVKSSWSRLMWATGCYVENATDGWMVYRSAVRWCTVKI